MGQCGCGDTCVEYKLPGPEGIVYGFQVYAPCPYCFTPASVIVYRFDTNDPDFAMFVDGSVEELPIIAYGVDVNSINGDCAITILDPEQLTEVMDELDQDDHGDAIHIVRDAMHKTQEKYDKMRIAVKERRDET